MHSSYLHGFFLILYSSRLSNATEHGNIQPKWELWIYSKIPGMSILKLTIIANNFSFNSQNWKKKTKDILEGCNNDTTQLSITVSWK